MKSQVLAQRNLDAVQVVREFLTVDTPAAWFQAARDNLPVLLMDHANCEKKAASTALSMMYRYVEYPHLLKKMSSLAREELRHFEQVLELMTDCGIVYEQINSSRYAQGLHKLVSKAEPRRLVDLLICGAVVEARSCERFAVLVQVLPEKVSELYRSLLNSEARHFKEYLGLAEEVNQQSGGHPSFDERVNDFLAADAELGTAADSQLRFHGGALAT
ncbi:MAG: tRNA-(ms[2]io[6]A)-hydroxylase [Pseudomonadota bacterium]|nr:tRNA-(ms[2]io[6]A)-hydroxylase [Pseudomonadota bacterium]